MQAELLDYAIVLAAEGEAPGTADYQKGFRAFERREPWFEGR